MPAAGVIASVNESGARVASAPVALSTCGTWESGVHAIRPRHAISATAARITLCSGTRATSAEPPAGRFTPVDMAARGLLRPRRLSPGFAPRVRICSVARPGHSA